MGLAALFVAGVAIYVLTIGQPRTSDRSRGTRSPAESGSDRPAMDEIDPESRAAMRELLRQVEED